MKKRETSRQVKWQRKQKEEGRCTKCGQYAIPNESLCIKCWLKHTYKQWKNDKKPSFNTKTIRSIQKMINDYSLRINLLKTKSQDGENPYKYIDATQPEQTNEILTKEK